MNKELIEVLKNNTGKDVDIHFKGDQDDVFSGTIIDVGEEIVHIRLTHISDDFESNEEFYVDLNSIKYISITGSSEYRESES